MRTRRERERKRGAHKETTNERTARAGYVSGQRERAARVDGAGGRRERAVLEGGAEAMVLRWGRIGKIPAPGPLGAAG